MIEIIAVAQLLSVDAKFSFHPQKGYLTSSKKDRFLIRDVHYA